MTYFKQRKNAFYYAFAGLWEAFRREAHVKIHVAATLVACTAAVYFEISRYEWMALLCCVCFVLALELINTALEKLCDLVMPEKHATIKYVKDLAAAAVLLAALFAFITGLLIFLPYVLN